MWYCGCATHEHDMLYYRIYATIRRVHRAQRIMRYELCVVDELSTQSVTYIWHECRTTSTVKHAIWTNKINYSFKKFK